MSRNKLLRVILVCCLLFLNTTAYSSSFLQVEGACSLYSNLETQENIGDVKSIPGKKYKIILSNTRKILQYLNVEVSDAYPKNRWIERSCGTVKTDEQFMPFFVHDNPKKNQQTFPTITNFDKTALEQCGYWGKHVRRKDLESLFSGEPLLFLYEKLNHSVITKNADVETFKKELTDIWVKSNGFQHIICGEPGHRRNNKNNQLGGLHYVGRYLELQDKNWGGLNTNCKRQNIKFPVYTIGIDFLTPNGNIHTKCPSGYNYQQSVSDIILKGTKAFKKARKNNNFSTNSRNAACTYNSAGMNYTFVTRNNAIVTFYSNLKPPRNNKDC
ncbi:MAG: EndoU domain-containing protein [Rickettsiaceae bacterium H1]|nr:EndoU domain-containing protein [Rickettsiaceae bacterium H1]